MKPFNRNIPIPTNSLKEMLQLILGENSFSFNRRNYLQTHGTTMGTKMAVAFANIFMSEVETEILKASNIKPLQWKRYIDDVFSLWGCERDKIQLFIKEANKHHATFKFTAEISEKEINFLERFHNDHILDMRTHYKSTETFQYTYFTSRHAPGAGKGFIKGEALRLLRTNSSEHTFKDNIANCGSSNEATQSIWLTTPLKKYNSRRESPPSRIKTKGERKYCLSSRNTIQQYLT